MTDDAALARLRAATVRAVGAHQTARAIARGRAAEVFVAADADARVIEPVVAAASAHGVRLVEVGSATALGRACGIAVGAAAAAVLVDGPDAGPGGRGPERSGGT
jgi:large subunit ribosomal protein L7A